MLNINTMIRKAECNKYWRNLAKTSGSELEELTSSGGYKTYRYTEANGNNIETGYDPKFRPIKTVAESLNEGLGSVKTYFNHRKGTLKTTHFDVCE